jgi:hypothetical protein
MALRRIDPRTVAGSPDFEVEEQFFRRGYPEVAGIEAAEFMRHIEPLNKKRIGELSRLEKESKEGRIPFVIVIKNELVVAESDG